MQIIVGSLAGHEALKVSLIVGNHSFP